MPLRIYTHAANRIVSERLCPRERFYKARDPVEQLSTKVGRVVLRHTAEREVAELKAFLKEILPYISGAFFKAANQISKTIEQEVDDTKRVRKIHDSFSPQLLISYRQAGHEYVLQMREDGATIIMRNETVTTSRVSSISNNNNSTHNEPRRGSRSSVISVDFMLGELVFIR